MFWGVQDDGLEMSIPLLNEHDPTHLYSSRSENVIKTVRPKSTDVATSR